MINGEAIYCAKSVYEILYGGTANSGFIVLFKGVWYKYQFAAGWLTAGMAILDAGDIGKTVVALSPKGAFWELESKDPRESTGELQGVTSPLRSVVTIDNIIYACGLGRTVFRREGKGTWSELGPGTTKRDDGESWVSRISRGFRLATSMPWAGGEKFGGTRRANGDGSGALSRAT